MKEKFQDEVILANENFYRAIEESDFERMEELWVGSEDDKCVHPGWPMLYGWEAVGESWKSIFENGGPIGIELTDVRAEVSGDVAWVICIEKISHRLGDEVQSGFAQSTNIFVRTDSSWLLSVHHASPMPTPGGEVSSNESLQ